MQAFQLKKEEGSDDSSIVELSPSSTVQKMSNSDKDTSECTSSQDENKNTTASQINCQKSSRPSFGGSEKPYVCHICQHGFVQSSNLKRHMLIHSGEKPYSCSQCSKTFTTASNMKIHMEIHKEDVQREKFTCKSCEKVFLYKCSLTKHEDKCKRRVHSNGIKNDEKFSIAPRKMIKKENLPTESSLNTTESNPKNPFFNMPQVPLNPPESLLMNPLINQALLLQAMSSQKLSQANKPLGNLCYNPLSSLFGGDLLLRSLTLNLELLSNMRMNSGPNRGVTQQ